MSVVGEGGAPPNVVVKQSDLPTGMQQRMIEIALDALSQCRTRTDTAKRVKESADLLWGPTWHAFVGSSYACQVKYARGSYLFMSVDTEAGKKLYFCVFKSPPLSQRKKPTVAAPRAPATLPGDYKILVSKMDPVMESHALAEADRAASSFSTYKEMALHVKQFFDAHYGSGWICLYGLLNTGSFATRDPVDYISFNLRSRIRVLIYRHHDGVEGQLVLSDVPERYYVQILPSVTRTLRGVMMYAIVPLMLASCAFFGAVADSYLAIPGIAHLYSLLAVHRCWPRQLLFAVLIALGCGGCAVAASVRHTRHCLHTVGGGGGGGGGSSSDIVRLGFGGSADGDVSHASITIMATDSTAATGGVCGRETMVHAAFIVAYVLHSLGVLGLAALSHGVRRAIRTVASGGGARPLFSVA